MCVNLGVTAKRFLIDVDVEGSTKILKYAQSNGSIASYVKCFHCMQFLTDSRNALKTVSCGICTDRAVHLPFHRIWMQPQIISNINIFMTGWNNICFTSQAWKTQKWFGLILCVYLGYKPYILLICLCRRCIYLTLTFSL